MAIKQSDKTRKNWELELIEKDYEFHKNFDVLVQETNNLNESFDTFVEKVYFHPATDKEEAIKQALQIMYLSDIVSWNTTHSKFPDPMLDELKKYLANNDYATDLSFFKLIFYILRRDRTLKNVENKNLIINEV